MSCQPFQTLSTTSSVLDRDGRASGTLGPAAAELLETVQDQIEPELQVVEAVRYTGLCPSEPGLEPDGHPSDAGYAKIADLDLEALLRAARAR